MTKFFEMIVAWFKSLFGLFTTSEPVEAPVTTPAPAPKPAAPVTVAPVDPLTGWPVGSYEFVPGAWYVPDAARGADAGPFTTPSEYVVWCAAVDLRDQNLAEWQRQFSAVRYIGLSGIDASTVHENRDETKYLWDARVGYFGDLHRVVLSGANVDMSRCINNGFYGAGSFNGGVRGALVNAVAAALVAQARGESPVYRTE